MTAMQTTTVMRTRLSIDTPSRHRRVVAARVERMAPAESLHRTPGSRERPIVTDALDRILRAARREPAARAADRHQERREHNLVRAHQRDQHHDHQRAKYF